MKKNRIILLFFFALILIIPFQVSHAETIQVCLFDCQYRSLKEAVEVASSGDIIRLKEGNYLENVYINKDLIIKGKTKKAVKIKGYTSHDPALRVGPSNVEVRLENITVSGGSKGLFATGESKVVLRECEISRNKIGIYADGMAEVRMFNTSVRRNRLDKINGAGLEIDDSATVIIRDSRILHNSEGIKVGGFSRLEVYNSAITGNIGTGLLAEESPNIYLQNNEFIGSYVYGVALILGECGFREIGETFTGTIAGKNNRFKETGIKPYCPVELSFLTTNQGDEYNNNK